MAFLLLYVCLAGRLLRPLLLPPAAIPDSMSESRSLGPSFHPKTPHSFLCVYFLFQKKKIKHDEQLYGEGQEGLRFVLSIEQPNADPLGSDPR